MFSASDLKKGLKVLVDDYPWIITDFEFCKPGKGTALYRCKMKNLITGSTMDRTFRPVDKIDKPDLEERETIFSYVDNDFFVFSDSDTYEEIHVSKDVIGDNAYFLIENSESKILMFNGAPIDVTLPTFIEKVIKETEPGARGDTATNVTKPAKIDNGYEIQVPLFINEGDTVRIDTRTGAYADRVSKA
ncbi:MAG: elongation factor P [Victivallaceae bacterium]|jgi:elongation factor P|nr:elongation factor P [Victivallaceae bacterium]MDD4318405.1 elongation factor P [Victivallaceae bacterium]